MSDVGSDYAVKRDIRNNPIVREIDRGRQRELWRSLGIGVALVVVLLFSAWQHFELLRHGYRIEQMEQERTRELQINRHLRLEIETLRSLARIERIATEQLGLVEPEAEEAIVIEQPEPPSTPPVSADEPVLTVATRRERLTEGLAIDAMGAMGQEQLGESSNAP